MTSKLKCPVCGSELVNIIGLPGCTKCNFLGNEYTQKALIQAKQDLEIATNALEEIAGREDSDMFFSNQTAAKEALKQIQQKD